MRRGKRKKCSGGGGGGKLGQKDAIGQIEIKKVVFLGGGPKIKGEHQLQPTNERKPPLTKRRNLATSR